jgi:hypothetical protein
MSLEEEQCGRRKALTSSEIGSPKVGANKPQNETK